METIEKLQHKIELMEQVIKDLATNSDYMCEYCEYHIPCLREKCEFYQEGVGMYDSNGKYYDWKWTCMDFNFGECEKMKDLPCCECITDDTKNQFKWNGQLRDKETK